MFTIGLLFCFCGLTFMTDFLCDRLLRHDLTCRPDTDLQLYNKYELILTYYVTTAILNHFFYVMCI